MAYGIKLEVWGDWAAFNRPEMKVERVSYHVMTPSAARGILEAIYWKPEMRWVVDRIHVLRPIRFAHVRRNEVSSRIPVKGATGVAAAMKARGGSLGICVAAREQRQQRAAMVLRDVRYGISAHVEIIRPDKGREHQDSVAKHLEMFKRRASRGQYFHHPYLGCREFPAHFRLVEEFPTPAPELLEGPQPRDLGFMLQDIDFVEDSAGRIVESNRGTRVTGEPVFFRAVMRNGVIEVPPREAGGR